MFGHFTKLCMKGLNSTILLRNLKRTLREPSGASEPLITFLSKKNLFFFLVMVYDRVSDRDKHSMKRLALESLAFILPVT